MAIDVGEVIAVQGVRVTLRGFEESNKDTLFFKGERYKGVSIREYISIRRGFRDIICIIEGEYLDERKFEHDGNKIEYIRKIETKPIGYFENDKFYEGIKFLPMIKDKAFLLEEGKISQIYSRGSKDPFVIGNMLKEDIPISLPWDRLFNTHIGIFGNTGSGKSNTLAKIYTVLFDQKLESIRGKSKFAIIDFNGEYTGDQITPNSEKTVIQLNTKTPADKFSLQQEEFWDAEILSILFQATTNTQRPFLKRVLDGREKYRTNQGSLANYIKATFEAVFTTAAPKPETLDLLRRISRILQLEDIEAILQKIEWFSRDTNKCFVISAPSRSYFNSDGTAYNQHLASSVNAISVNDVDPFDELIIRANLRLVRDILNGYVQFEHIQPLLKRIDASLLDLRKVVDIQGSVMTDKIITVISLRNCNQQIKKVLPLLIAKHFYWNHKKDAVCPPDKTMHLIIDEAHNILSLQSSSEHESWKDYRLELFEEIIKEGRKFGVFLTLASQRPADISPTIISQVHNFFIHRLVNDKDLYLLENTISTLDALSRSLIPNLAKGSCIITGTSFDLPIVLQINQLDLNQRPNSEDVDLTELWQ